MMSANSQAIPSIPKETVKAANAVFGRRNFHIVIGENLEIILEQIQLQSLLEQQGFSKLEGAILALITCFQFMEGLTDVQAIDAVRTRIDWKFALHLSLMPTILHESRLCEFRQRVLRNPAMQREFQKLLHRLSMFVPSLHNFQNLKSQDVISFVCSINRLHRAQQAMSQVLEVLATRFPDWLRKVALPHWYGRYNPAIPRLDVAILLGQQRFLMEEIESDIQHLLQQIHQSSPPALRELHEVKAIQQVWLQFQTTDKSYDHGLEVLQWEFCNTCSYKAARRRLPV